MQLVLVQAFSRGVPRQGLAHCEASSDSEKGKVCESLASKHCSRNLLNSSSFRISEMTTRTCLRNTEAKYSQVTLVLPHEQQDVSHAFAMKKKSCEAVAAFLFATRKARAFSARFSEQLSLQLPAGCKFAARVCLPTPGKLQSKPFSASFSDIYIRRS